MTKRALTQRKRNRRSLRNKTLKNQRGGFFGLGGMVQNFVDKAKGFLSKRKTEITERKNEMGELTNCLNDCRKKFQDPNSTNNDNMIKNKAESPNLNRKESDEAEPPTEPSTEPSTKPPNEQQSKPIMYGGKRKKRGKKSKKKKRKNKKKTRRRRR